MIYVADLIFNLERASAPSTSINRAIYWWEHPECRDRNKVNDCPDYTGSIDAATAFAQRISEGELSHKASSCFSPIGICLAALKSSEWHRGMRIAKLDGSSHVGSL